MGSASDKAKGLGNQVVGSVKEGVGKATNNSSLEGEGIAQRGKGKMQESIGKAKDGIKNAVDKM